MSNPVSIIMEQRLETINELGIEVGNIVKLRDGRLGKITQLDVSHMTGYPVIIDTIGSYTLEGKFSIYYDEEHDSDIIDWDYKEPEEVTPNHPDISYWDNGEVIEVPSPNTFINDVFIKHDNGKPLISLIDPKFIEGLATVMTQGANKYGRDNWKECKEPHRYLDALLRHTLKYWDGEKVDTESGKSHLYHIAFNAMALDYLDNKLKD